MQKQYFSQIRRQFFNVTGMLLTSFIAIPALAAQGGFSAEKEPVVTERCTPVIKFSRRMVKVVFRPFLQCAKGRG